MTEQGEGGFGFFNWVDNVLDCTRPNYLTGLYLPMNQMGPDCVIALRQSATDLGQQNKDRVILIFVQCKVVKTISRREIQKALDTTDPSKFYHINRGKNEESAIKCCEDKQKEFYERLKNIPVVRVLVSAIFPMKKGPVLVGNDGHSELLLFIDESTADKVFGKVVMECIRRNCGVQRNSN